jgi:hypothetical protein
MPIDRRSVLPVPSIERKSQLEDCGEFGEVFWATADLRPISRRLLGSSKQIGTIRIADESKRVSAHTLTN